ncbi:MAG: tetratricopeptide repeat protein [Lachnospiraceae bacterium]|nr:tetratricopeptide repeat protein [Lachnospiraceae bacterium]
MSESNQEGYQTLGWIVNQSEQGLFLVVADETVQEEIVNIYRNGAVKIYDYKRHPGAYAFQHLQELAAELPATKVFMIANFQLAVQDEESLKRLNFSRDMLDGLEKNFIFLVTPYGDDRLAVKACDFYSFVKLRITFHNYIIKCEKEKKLLSMADESVKESGWKPEELKQKLAESYVLLEQAKDESDKAHYYESEKLLLKAREIKVKLLGTEHLEIAGIDHELAGVYANRGKYAEAEELYKKSLRIRKKILGEEHPSTAASYHNLGGVYESQGKYAEAEELYRKSLHINEKVLGEEHPSTAMVYHNLGRVYESQEEYEMAVAYYLKAYKILVHRFGADHPDTKIVCENIKLVQRKLSL